MSLQKKQRLISMFIVTAPPGVRWINHGRKWNTGSPIHSGRHLASVRHKENWPSSFMSVIARARNAERYTTPEIYRVDLR